MDAVQFDRWTKRLVERTRSRRGLFRAGLAGGLAIVGYGQMAEEAAACRRNGKPCGKGRHGDCCSGTCKKGKCRPTRGAAGCTVKDDACKGDAQTRRCPKNPDGACILLDNGKPFCYESGSCIHCTSNADCTTQAGGVAGKCLKTCGVCTEDSNGRACVYEKSLT